jgi:hypothetical protein
MPLFVVGLGVVSGDAIVRSNGAEGKGKLKRKSNLGEVSFSFHSYYFVFFHCISLSLSRFFVDGRALQLRLSSTEHGMRMMKHGCASFFSYGGCTYAYVDMCGRVIV